MTAAISADQRRTLLLQKTVHVHERRRIGDNGRDLLVQPRLVAAAEDEFGNKIRRARRTEMK